MTNWIQLLKSVLDQAVAAGAEVSENSKAITVQFSNSPDEILLGDWSSVTSGLKRNGFSVVAEDSTEDTIDLVTDSLEKRSDLKHIFIRKNHISGSYFFFDVVAFEKALNDHVFVSNARRVYLASDFDEFETRSCSFLKMLVNLPQKVDEDSNREPFNAKKLVRDAGAGVLPGCIDFWIEVSRPKNSRVYDAWKKSAVANLHLILVDEIWPSDDVSLRGEMVLKGARRLQLPLHQAGPEFSDEFFETITYAIGWLAENSRERSIRHTLLVNRIASEWPSDDVEWIDGIRRVLAAAVDGAETDYKAHLHEMTAETLKSLSDLRKHFNEESGKIADRSQSLSLALYRDLVVAVTVIGIRFWSISQKNADSTLSVIFLGLAVLWLWISYWLNIKSNKDFLRVQSRSRASWHRRIYTTLSGRDFDVLARRPIKEAFRAYERNVIRVRRVYIGTTVILFLAALLPALMLIPAYYFMPGLCLLIIFVIHRLASGTKRK